jgi:peptide-methionine (S)-S-oxide reductase
MMMKSLSKLLTVPLILVEAFSSSTLFVPTTTRQCSSLPAIKEATYGMGCFWDPAESLLKVNGVIGTTAGYTGNPNAEEAPTYDNVCFGREWVEGVRVRYDDEKISYEELLEAFFEAQKPKFGSRQYASIIFPHDPEQQKIAIEWIEANKARQRNDGWTPEMTTVEPLTKFFKAEGYHQRYWQKQRPRFAVIFSTIAVASGALNSFIPENFQSTVETAANSLGIAIALYMIVERKLDAEVVEL